MKITVKLTAEWTEEVDDHDLSIAAEDDESTIAEARERWIASHEDRVRLEILYLIDDLSGDEPQIKVEIVQ